MAGGYLRLVNRDSQLLSAGLTGMDWRFAHDAGEYTFGHGGYYSPQKYDSLAIPITGGAAPPARASDLSWPALPALWPAR